MGSEVVVPRLWNTGSVAVAHGLGYSKACGIFPDQQLNPCLLHWQADSLPLSHQGSVVYVFLHTLHACSTPHNMYRHSMFFIIFAFNDYLLSKMFRWEGSLYIYHTIFIIWCFPGGSVVKNPPANARGSDSIPGLGRCPGEGNGNPLQHSCLENSMNRGSWHATVHGVTRVRYDWAHTHLPITTFSIALVPSFGHTVKGYFLSA